MSELGSLLFTPQNFKRFQSTVDHLLEGKKRAEFRDHEGNAVAIYRRKIFPRIGITRRSNDSYDSPDGTKNYPYKKIVLTRNLHPTEEMGTMRRNNKGILVPFEEGKPAPKRERVRRKNPFKEIFSKETPTDELYASRVRVELSVMNDGNGTDVLRNYTLSVEMLKGENIHDEYGRTTNERDQEEAILTEFDTQTKRLLALARLRGIAQETTDTSSTRASVSSTINRYYSATYTAPNGDEIGIRQQPNRKFLSFFGPATETTVSVYSDTDPTIGKEYKVRRSDGRLGVVNRGLDTISASNPASIAESEALIGLLYALR